MPHLTSWRAAAPIAKSPFNLITSCFSTSSSSRILWKSERKEEQKLSKHSRNEQKNIKPGYYSNRLLISRLQCNLIWQIWKTPQKYIDTHILKCGYKLKQTICPCFSVNKIQHTLFSSSRLWITSSFSWRCFSNSFTAAKYQFLYLQAPHKI